jgi:hypothetical protein
MRSIVVIVVIVLIAEPAVPSEEGAVTEGSPADQFLTEDVVTARNEDPDQPAGD